MIAARRLTRGIAAALALVLVLGVAPAFADVSTPTVAFHVTVSGVDLKGMDATQAGAAIVAACATPTLAPLAATAHGAIYTLDVASAVTCDVDGMVAAALAATEDTVVPAAWAPNAPAITTFIAQIAKAVNSKPVDAKRTIKKKRLKVIAPVAGRTVDTAAGQTLVSGAIVAELAAGGVTQPAVVIPITLKDAKVTMAKLGKTIVVVLSERRLYLYSGAKIDKQYRCAVGQKRYPTPVGIWKIVRKVKNPSWHNNGSAWASRMAAYIPPGRNNPLGTRALYLDASGIRIHGIPASENSSIGHAASHGCIRLKNSNAVKLYPLVKVGTPVYIVK
jgi:lipoprotein-anchoring transpeptidase ErfK/SrfK